MSRKQIILTTVALGAVVAGLVIYFFVSNSGFRLKSTFPELDGDIPSSTPQITLKFSHDLRPEQEIHNKISGDIQPVNNLSIEGKELIISLSSLTPDTDYRLELSNIQSARGEQIDKLELRFRAVYVPYQELSEEQKAAQLKLTDHNNNEDPINRILPAQGTDYYLSGKYVTSDDGTQDFTLEAQLFLKRADANNRQAAINRYQQAVVDYIKSEGFNVDDYFIDYVIIDPPSN